MARNGKKKARPRPPAGLDEWTMAALEAAGRTLAVSSLQLEELPRGESSDIPPLRFPDQPLISDWVGPLAADTETARDVLHVYLPDHRLLNAMDSKRADKFLVEACRELRRRHPKRVFVCCFWNPCGWVWPRTTKFILKVKAKVSMTQEVARWWDQVKAARSAKPAPG